MSKRLFAYIILAVTVLTWSVTPCRAVREGNLLPTGTRIVFCAGAAKTNNLTFTGGKLEIEAGSLDADTEISAREVAVLHHDPRFIRTGQAFDFGPNGLSFKKPVKLTLSYASGLGFAPENLTIYYYNEACDRWLPLKRLALNKQNRTVTVQITHFSTYAPGSGCNLVEEGLSPHRTYFKNNNELVDPQSGNLSIYCTDLSYPGRGINFELKRSFSMNNYYMQYLEPQSGSTTCPSKNDPIPPLNFGIGEGWNFNFPYFFQCYKPGYEEISYLSGETGALIDIGYVFHDEDAFYPYLDLKLTGAGSLTIYVSNPDPLPPCQIKRILEIPKEKARVAVTLNCVNTGFQYVPEIGQYMAIWEKTAVNREYITADGRCFEYGLGNLPVKIWDKTHLNHITVNYVQDPSSGLSRIGEIIDTVGRSFQFDYYDDTHLRIRHNNETLITYTLGALQCFGGHIKFDGTIIYHYNRNLLGVTVPVDGASLTTAYTYTDNQTRFFSNAAQIGIQYPSGGSAIYEIKDFACAEFGAEPNLVYRLTPMVTRGCSSDGVNPVKETTFTYYGNYLQYPMYQRIPFNEVTSFPHQYQDETKLTIEECPGVKKTKHYYDKIDYIEGGLKSVPFEAKTEIYDSADALKRKTEKTYELTEYHSPVLTLEKEYRNGAVVYSKEYKYDDFGQKTWEKDALGHEKFYAYVYSEKSGAPVRGFITNTYGFNTSGSDPFYSADGVPNLFEQVKGEAEKINGSGLTKETYYQFDQYCNLKEIKQKDRTYNNNPRGMGWAITGFKYDYDISGGTDYGNLKEITDPKGNLMILEYDPKWHAYIFKDKRQISYAGESRWDQGYWLINEFDYYVGDPDDGGNDRGYMKSKKVYLSTDGANPLAGYVSDETSYIYDALDRITEVWMGGVRRKVYTYDNHPYNPADPGKNTLTVEDALGNYTVKTYDGLDRLVQERVYDKNDVFCGQKKYEYHPTFTDKVVKEIINKVPHTTNPAEQVITETAYDCLGRATQLKKNGVLITETIYNDTDNTRTVKNYRDTDPNHYVWKEYAYDWNERLLRVKEHDKSPDKTTDDIGTTTYSYDEPGNLIQVTNAENVWTKYYYNTLGKLEKTEYMNGTYEELAYDACGNLTSKRDRKGAVINYAYDTINRLRAMTAPEYAVKYEYNQFGSAKNVKKIMAGQTDADYEALTEVNGLGLVTEAYQKIGRQQVKEYHLSYLYDNANNPELVTVRDSAGTEVKALDYEPGVQVNRLKVNGSEIASVTSSFAGVTGHITYGNGLLTTSYQYDAMLRPTSIHNGTLMANSYTYDNQGNIRSWNGKTYKYDGLDRLLKAEGAASEEYTYDKLGNRYSSVKNGIVKEYTYNTYKNLVQTAGDASFVHDANGNRIAKTEDGHTWNYNYDCENRLTSVTKDSQTYGTYYYDAAGMRVKKVEGGKTTVYVYNGAQCIYEETFNSTDQGNLGTPAEKNVYASLANMNLAEYKNGVLHYLLLDHLGSTKTVADANGQLITKLDYDAFGNKTLTAEETRINEPFDSTTGWTISDPHGALFQAVSGSLRVQHTTCDYAGDYIVRQFAELKDAVFEFDLTLGQVNNDCCSLLVESNGFALVFYGRNLYYYYNSAWTLVSTVNFGQQYHYRIEVTGGSLKVSINGELKFTRAGSFPAKTYIGFRDYGLCTGPVTNYVDNLKVYPCYGENYAYTGKKADEETGLVYFGARYYDPEIGRFVTQDTYTCLPNDKRILNGALPSDIIAKGSLSPQRCNQYVFCLNNPITFVDPDGHETDEEKKERNEKNKKRLEEAIDRLEKTKWGQEHLELIKELRTRLKEGRLVIGKIRGNDHGVYHPESRGEGGYIAIDNDIEDCCLPGELAHEATHMEQDMNGDIDPGEYDINDELDAYAAEYAVNKEIDKGHADNHKRSKAWIYINYQFDKY
ncbi:MAG: RHS repeat-associated core domain-containing protein [Bacillota bacterium]